MVNIEKLLIAINMRYKNMKEQKLISKVRKEHIENW